MGGKRGLHKVPLGKMRFGKPRADSRKWRYNWKTKLPTFSLYFPGQTKLHVTVRDNGWG